MTRLLLALSLLVAPCAAYAQGRPKIVVLKEPRFLCKRMADIEQFTRLVVHGDDVALNEFSRAKRLEDIPGTGSACRIEQAGETLTVSDSAEGSVVRLECFRPSGYAVCYWGMAEPAE